MMVIFEIIVSHHVALGATLTRSLAGVDIIKSVVAGGRGVATSVLGASCRYPRCHAYGVIGVIRKHIMALVVIGLHPVKIAASQGIGTMGGLGSRVNIRDAVRAIIGPCMAAQTVIYQKCRIWISSCDGGPVLHVVHGVAVGALTSDRGKGIAGQEENQGENKH